MRLAATARKVAGAFSGGIAAVIACLVLAQAPRTQAQSYPPDPYAAQTGQPAQGASTGANQPGYGAGQQGGAYYNPGGGTLQSGIQSGGYSPTYIPSLPSQAGQSSAGAPDGQAMAGQNARDVQLNSSPDQDTNPGALYARPGAAPGQFELYRRPPPALSEFEKFVQQAAGRPIPRFGSNLILTRARNFALSPTTTVPPDYRLNAGDELVIEVTGSVEANLRLVIDSEGRIFIPRIGAVNVAGVRYGDLENALSRRFAEQFKQANVSVVIGHLHGLNIYVTGYAVSPGAYTVSSLSTMIDAVLAAGGPAAGGSFRSIQLRRNGQLVTTLDLYELLLNGDTTRDSVLQNNDVLNIGPAGPELAVTGSVNSEAIFEATAGETVADMIRFAGGPNSLADDARVILTRLKDLDAAGSEQIAYSAVRNLPVERADVIRLLSLGEVVRPAERQAVLVTVDGEVDHPGRYYLKPGATMDDVLAQAGGLTGGAFVFGTHIDRESVQRQQQSTFNRAIDDLEMGALTASLDSLNGSSGHAADSSTRLQVAMTVIQRLRNQKADGRLILNLPANANALPGRLVLENNDKIFVPPVPKTVGVFGAVYRPGSFLFGDAQRLGDYVRLAGGPQRYADHGDLFVVRANGAVLSMHADNGFYGRPALPGDVIFVPVRTTPSSWQKFLEFASAISQLGVSALTISALAN